MSPANLQVIDQHPARKLLVIDDEQDIREVTSEFLEGLGFDVEIASDVDEAFSKIKSKKFDLVVCDIFLKSERLGGIQVLEKLSQMFVPVVLISGHASVEALKKAVNLGAIHFLEKPFSMESLQTVVDEVLSKPSGLQEKLSELVERHGLTTREKQIFEYLSRGLANKEIANMTETSERTVKAHISSIFKKCDVSSRSELLSRLLN